MKALPCIALCGALLGGTCFAGWIDQRESPVMLDLLQRSGVQTQTDASGASVMQIVNVSCVHSYPIHTSVGDSDDTTTCSYTDKSDSKALSLPDSDAKVFFELAAHYGGNLNQYDQNDIRYQDFTAESVKCEQDVGPDEPWLCEVSDQ